LVLAIVLGDLAESNFRNAIKGAQGDLTIFWSEPLVAVIMTLGMLMLAWPIIGWLKEKLAGPKKAASRA
jgi:putative tricarboxylic transport membrane protein